MEIFFQYSLKEKNIKNIIIFVDKSEFISYTLFVK